MLPVADPGFPRGGGANSPGGGIANIRFCQIFCKNFITLLADNLSCHHEAQSRFKRTGDITRRPKQGISGPQKGHMSTKFFLKSLSETNIRQQNWSIVFNGLVIISSTFI